VLWRPRPAVSSARPASALYRMRPCSISRSERGVTVADDRKRLFADLARDFGKLDIGRHLRPDPTGSTDEAIFENGIRTRIFISYRQKDTIAIAGRIV
jgi:hypothetical protein